MSSDDVAGSERQPICPRCGSDSGGAAWCPKCGLNLRVRDGPSPGSEAKRTPATPAASTAGGLFRSRRGVAAAAAAVLVVVSAAVAIVLLTRDGGSDRTIPAVLDQSLFDQPSGTTSSLFPTTSESAEPTVTTDDMHRVLISYATAYSDEDLIGLRRLFAEELIRVSGAGPAESLEEALETYRGQFSELSNPDYSLSELTYSEGVYEGTASGVYSIISTSAPDAKGDIRFHFVTRGGQLLIDELTIEPY